ncbi:MAG: bifunctional metallophosphatase/5'-nucleotidase [Eubacteriaceae bacterium]|nr:bifunctional metallophosphatase/5'-nucleotidase [Eubacteriaceae bacterium]
MDKDRFKKLVLLHSNDLHGDFLDKEHNGALIGGVSLLSGYVQKARDEDTHVIYCVAGDMLQGSLIDSEYKGLSTIEIMNMLSPDIASLGNHETDYGLTHLLFLERCARFPIVNANIFIRNPLTRLFQPFDIIEVNGMKIMFIGIITDEVMNGIKNDYLISKLIDVYDAAVEVGRIVNAYRAIDIDLTVLLTHIGFEEDKKLAALLDPEWGVDLIIGGHSHTLLEKPEVVNDILIAQAVCGTDQVGRFDLVVDTELDSVASYDWQLVPINNKTCPKDEVLENIVLSYKEQTDEKFNRVLCRLPQKLTHPNRYMETELGNLFADSLKICFGTDIVLYGSGSIRLEEIGPIILQKTLLEAIPFHSKVYMVTVTGKQLMSMIKHMLREDAFIGEHTEFFQYSKGLEAVWSRTRQEFIKFTYNGEPIDNETKLSITIQGYHRDNFSTSFGMGYEEVLANGREYILATDEQEVLLEFFTDNEPTECGIDGRLVVLP